MNDTSTSPIPDWSSINHQDNTVSLPINGRTEILAGDTPVEYIGISGESEMAHLRDVKFSQFKGESMKVQRDIRGKVARITLGNMVEITHLSRGGDLAVRTDRGGSIARTINPRPNPNNDSDGPLSLCILLAEAIHKMPPIIVNIPPTYSDGHTYTGNRPPSTAVGYLLQGSTTHYSHALQKKLPRTVLLEELSSFDVEGKSWHPVMRKYIEEHIEAITDSTGNFIIENVYGDFLMNAPLDIRIMLYSFLRVFISDNEGAGIREKILFEYSTDGFFFPYREIQETIENKEDVENLVKTLVFCIRQIPPKMRVPFLQLLSEDPIIDKLRDKIKDHIHFEHQSICSLDGVVPQLRDNLLKNINWFELSDGCSVGCSFCSADAPRKKPKELSHFPASDIMLLGASYGKEFNPTFYYASDPLDWEGKLGDMDLHYFDLHSLHLLLTGNHAYISTAIPKHKIDLAREYADMIDRISVSFWNEKRVQNSGINQTGGGLIYTNRRIGSAEAKKIVWYGIPVSRTNKDPVMNDVNAWFPSCDSGVLISPNSVCLRNLVNLEKRDLSVAPQGYFTSGIDSSTSRYLSGAVSYGKYAGDISVLQELMTGSIALPEHTNNTIQRKTKQTFGEGSFLLRVLGFDGQERKYVFVYKYEGKSSALIYCTPQMYEDIYFTGNLRGIQHTPKQQELVPSGPALANLTAHQVIDGIDTDQRKAIIRFLSGKLQDFENCCFTVQEAKYLIENLIKDQGPREDEQCAVIERLIKVIMFSEKIFDVSDLLQWLQSLRNNTVLISALQIQLDATIEHLSSYK